MKLYLDASVVVALLVDDAFTARAESFIRSNPATLLVSDFAAAEFASVVARRVRTGLASVDAGHAAFMLFDEWRTLHAEAAETTTADVMFATASLRRLDLTLRTADAINIAIAHRADAVLMTFDTKMALAAERLGVGVAAA